MSDEKSIQAVFSDLEPAADAIEQLRLFGVGDACMNIVSGVPLTEAMLGRPRQWTNVPRLALGGAAIGLLTGIFLSFIVPDMYTVKVGGQPFTPVPPSVIVIFEMTMLITLLSTFLGVFLDSYFPNYRPMHYVPETSDGKIIILIECPMADEFKITELLKKLGAESVHQTEAQHL